MVPHDIRHAVSLSQFKSKIKNGNQRGVCAGYVMFLFLTLVVPLPEYSGVRETSSQTNPGIFRDYTSRFLNFPGLIITLVKTNTTKQIEE